MIKEKRICFCCGSSSTYMDHRGAVQWRHNYDKENNILCFWCDRKYITNPITNPKNNIKKMHTNGHCFFISWLERIGICNFCCAVKDVNTKSTIWHHQKGFFIIFPWFGVIELCVRCHNKESILLHHIKRDKKSGRFTKN